MLALASAMLGRLDGLTLGEKATLAARRVRNIFRRKAAAEKLEGDEALGEAQASAEAKDGKADLKAMAEHKAKRKYKKEQVASAQKQAQKQKPLMLRQTGVASQAQQHYASLAPTAAQFVEALDPTPAPSPASIVSVPKEYRNSYDEYKVERAESESGEDGKGKGQEIPEPQEPTDKSGIPDWARGPNLKAQLARQYGGPNPVDPDTIFSPQVVTVDLGAIFNMKKSGWARTSSENWHTDPLTIAEKAKAVTREERDMVRARAAANMLADDEHCWKAQTAAEPKSREAAFKAMVAASVEMAVSCKKKQVASAQKRAQHRKQLMLSQTGVASLTQKAAKVFKALNPTPALTPASIKPVPKEYGESENWHADRITIAEKRAYERAMGYDN